MEFKVKYSVIVAYLKADILILKNMEWHSLALIPFVVYMHTAQNYIGNYVM